jgi:hypothetical protein
MFYFIYDDEDDDDASFRIISLFILFKNYIILFKFTVF